MKDISKQNGNYLSWLNGLKGIACMGVFLHHFFLANRNGAVFGPLINPETATPREIFLSTNTAGFFLNGSYHVCVFLLVSAFLLARQVFLLTAKEENITEKLSGIVIKRYFRLLIPVGFFCLLNWFLIKGLTATGLNYVHKTTELTFIQLLSHIFVRVWTLPDTEMIGPLWMMTYLFVGSFIAIITALMAGKERKHMWIIYLVATAFFFHSNPFYFVSMLGVDIAYLTERTGLIGRIEKGAKPLVIILGVILLALSVILGGYPTYYISDNFYKYFNKLRENIANFYVVMHGLGAFCLVLSVYFLKPFAQFLSLKVFRFLGDISMGIYLIHIMVIEYFGYFFLDVLKQKMAFIPAFWVAFLVVCVITLLLAWCSKNTIEKWGEKLIKRMFAK